MAGRPTDPRLQLAKAVANRGIRQAAARARSIDPLAPVKRAGFPYAPAPIPRGVEPKAEPSRLGADYDTEWARTPAVRFARQALVTTVGRAVSEALAEPMVVNEDRLEGLDGPLIFVANHHSHLDTTVLLTHLPMPWRNELVVAAAADYFFARRSTAALAAFVYGAVPMERRKISRQSTREVGRLIAEGWSLLIFPEGGRSPDGWGQEFKGGAAYLALKQGVPVVPVHLDGTGRVLPKGSRIPKPERVTINIGTPLVAREKEDARKFAVRLEAAVAELADESTSDWWSAKLRAKSGATPSLRGPEVNSWRRDWVNPNRGRGIAGPPKRRWPA